MSNSALQIKTKLNDKNDSFPTPERFKEVKVSRAETMGRFLGKIGARTMQIPEIKNFVAATKLQIGLFRTSNFGQRMSRGLNRMGKVAQSVMQAPSAFRSRFQSAQEARANKKEIGQSKEDLYQQSVFSNHQRAMALLKKFPIIFKYFQKTHGSLDLPKNISKTNVTDLANRFDQVFLGSGFDADTGNEITINTGINQYLNQLRSDEMDPVTKAQIQGALIQASEGLHRLMEGTNLSVINEQGYEVKRTVENNKLNVTQPEMQPSPIQPQRPADYNPMSYDQIINSNPMSYSETANGQVNSPSPVTSESEPFDPNRFVRQIDPNLQLEAQNMIQMQKQIADLKAENARLLAENANLQQSLNSGATPAEPGSLFDQAIRRPQREDNTPPGMNGASMSYIPQDFNLGPPPSSDLQ